MPEPVQSPPPTGAPARSLKRARKDARHDLADARELLARARKSLPDEKRQAVADGIAGLEAAVRGESVAELEAATKRLEAVVDKHLASARRNPTLEYLISIGKALLLALVLRLFVIEAFKIPSGSMIPTLAIGDHLFVNKLSYGVRLPVIDWEAIHWGGYQRGDVIVFVNPLDDGLPLLQRRDYIKRIVGLPGDLVEVKDEVVHVNGVAQPRTLAARDFPYWERLGDDGPWIELEGELWRETLRDPTGRALEHDVTRAPDRLHTPYEGPFKVPEGHLFMMGDNRDNSQDGRAGGWYVPFNHVKGRALFIWLSWGKPGWWLWGDGGLRFERFFRGVQ